MASEFLQAITAGKTAIDGVKMLRQYAEEVKDIQKRGEFMRIIGELSIDLAETQIKLSECITENYELKEETKRLKKEIDDLKNPNIKMQVKEGLYYTLDGDGPFCTACHDSKNKSIRLTEKPEALQVFGKYQCPVCNAHYGEVEY